MEINKEYVSKVADLAKLNVNGEEEKYVKQLSDIMHEIDKIKNVETGGEVPMRTPLVNINDYRKEEISVLTKEEVLKEANSKDEEYVIVPKVIGWQII